MTEKLHTYVEALRAKNAGWVTEVIEAHGELSVIVPRENIIEISWYLKREQDFDMLADLCGADRGPEEDPRFVVNYHILGTRHHDRLRLKVRVDEDDPHIPSVCEVWKTANWHERETYDMFGVIFDGHPDLRRILLPSDFDGHALRKDYPLRGYEPYSLN